MEKLIKRELDMLRGQSWQKERLKQKRAEEEGNGREKYKSPSRRNGKRAIGGKRETEQWMQENEQDQITGYN